MRIGSRFFAASAVAGLIFAATPAFSQQSLPQILIGDRGGPCWKQVIATEKAQQIPPHLLAAISVAESGRYDEDTQETIAWPWTINAEGQGMYFATKEKAIAAVRRLRAKGVQSIDVGCMQVNLYHHPDAFANLEEAFDPATNVAYAAQFLKSLRGQLHSWSIAVAHYHSTTIDFGMPYRAKVYRLWARIRHLAAVAKQQQVIAAYMKRERARRALDAERRAEVGKPVPSRVSAEGVRIQPAGDTSS